MQHQSTTSAMSTQELLFSLDETNPDDEGKLNWRDGLATLVQVGSAVGFCWIVNIVVL